MNMNPTLGSPRFLPEFSSQYLLLAMCLLLLTSLGCPATPPSPKQAPTQKDASDEPTDASLADEPQATPAENGTATAEPTDDAAAVEALQAAGVIFKRNDNGQVVEANCKPAQMTNELMELLKGIPHVVVLDLENGQFDNAALEVLGQLPQLKTVNMRQCSKIDAEGLAHLKLAPQLERLLLLYTRTDDDGLGHVAALTNLRVLDLRGTKIGDDGINKLTGLTNLVDLKIRAPNVTGASMATIGTMTRLRYLALEDASVGDDHIGELAPLKALVNFNIMRTFVSDEGLAHFAEQKFQDLRLRDTAVGGAGLDALKGSLESLTFLDLSETLINNDGLAHIAPFTNLQSLLVWNGTMDDDGLAALTGLKKLKFLDIHGCRSLTSGCVEHLLKLEELEELNIAETNLDDDGLEQLAQLGKLKKLHVGQTSVTQQGIAAFREKLPSCTVIE